MKDRPAGIDILNCAAGHAEVRFNNADPIELERGKRIISDMLRRGYVLFVHGDGDRLVRVESFDPEKGVYIIGDGALYAGDDEPAQVTPSAEEPARVYVHGKPQKKPGRPAKREIPMQEAAVTSIGRSAGG